MLIQYWYCADCLILSPYRKYMAGYVSPNWTDEMLLDLIRREDDRAAFAELYDRYWKVLIDMAGKRGLSIETAEEIVQDVFVDLYLRSKDIEVNSLEAYLRNAVRNQVYKAHRSNQVHENYVHTMTTLGQPQTSTPDQLLEARQLWEQIDHATEKMSAPCREVFMLSRVEQLSNKDIAYKMAISLAMVRKHITKSMNLMRSRFKDYQINIILAILYFMK